MRRVPLRRRTPARPYRQSRPGLRQARTYVESRCHGRCEAQASPDCTGRGSQAHHRLMRSQGGTDDPGNLLWTCAECHRAIHHCPAEAFERGWLLHRWEVA